MFQKKERNNGSLKSSPQRKFEKVIRVPLTGWEVNQQNDDYGISQWCEWRSKPRKNKITARTVSYDDDCETFRNCFRQKCSAIDSFSLFQRESLNERFLQNCQFSGNYSDITDNRLTANNEQEREDRLEKSEELNKSAKRVCKSANSSIHSSAGITVQSGTSTEETVSINTRRHSAQDQTEDPDNKDDPEVKIPKLVGLEKSFVRKEDHITDELEDENDEGYGSKVSSNETETDAGDSSGVQNASVKKENDGKISQTESTFKWIRENDHSRIVKLSYSQKDRSMYSDDSVANKSKLIGESIAQPGGRCIKGIMAASLSHLSPGTMHFHHLRDPNKIAYLNHVDSPRWGYENNSNGQFLPNKAQKVTDSSPEIKPTAIVLRKVSIQNCSKNDHEPVVTDSRIDEALRDSMSSRERSKCTLHRTSPQLVVDSTKLQRNVSIPSSRHYAYFADSANNSVVNQSDEPRTPLSSIGSGEGIEITSHLYVTDRCVSGYFPIGDLLPAVERNIRQRTDNQLHKSASSGSFTFTSKDNKTSSFDARSMAECDSSMITRHDVDVIHSSYVAPHGPPAFRPLYARSPLQRAREIASRRLHGHVTQQPDGSSTIQVTSPRFGYRHDTRQVLRHDPVDRLGSAGKIKQVKLGLFGSVAKLQDRASSARSTTSRQSFKRSIQRKRMIYKS